MSAPLLTISVDLESGARRLVCGSCAEDVVLDAAGSTARSASVTAFVAAHAACHRSATATPADRDDRSG